jgi:NAD(P)-dependent dehydrogenase (short-subunit alcohol dehydrogenase family)
MDLKDKRALITGGTSGMGSAVALAMAEKGASVVITGRDETRGEGTVEQIRAGGHEAQFLAADFSEMSEVGRVADAAGEIDVLVNMAGFAALGSTADTDEAAFDGLFQINVKAPFFLVAALAPKIAARGGGAIINISTMVARYGQLGMAAYGASRASIELLTKAWAAEYGPQNIRVNAVAPGPTLTPSVEPRLEMARSSPRGFRSAGSPTFKSCRT